MAGIHFPWAKYPKYPTGRAAYLAEPASLTTGRAERLTRANCVGDGLDSPFAGVGGWGGGSVPSRFSILRCTTRSDLTSPHLTSITQLPPGSRFRGELQQQQEEEEAIDKFKQDKELSLAYSGSVRAAARGDCRQQCIHDVSLSIIGLVTPFHACVFNLGRRHSIYAPIWWNTIHSLIRYYVGLVPNWILRNDFFSS